MIVEPSRLLARALATMAVVTCLMLSFGVLAHALHAKNDHLRFATMDLKPYGWVDNNGINQGVIYEMNQEIGLRFGLSFDNTIMPFSRMAELLKLEHIDLISSQPHKEILEAGDKLAVQHNVNVIAVTKKGSAIKELDDLKNAHLIYHDLASYSKLEGYPKSITRVPSYEQMLKMLYHHESLDAGVMSEPAFYYFVKQTGLTPEDFGEIITIHSDIEQWIIVRKGLDNDTRAKLETIVTSIYQESMYERLIDELK